MPSHEAPCLELGSAPRTPSVIGSASPSETSSASSPEPPNIRATPLFRALSMPPPEPEQPEGQDELERRLPGYRRIVIPRDLTLIELLKEYSGVTLDEEVLRIREAKLRVVAERVGLRRLHVLVPRLRSLTLDGSAIQTLRELGIGLIHLKMLSVNRCGLTSLDGVWGVGPLRELHAAGNRIQDLHPLAVLQKLNTLNLSNNPISESSRIWTLGVCSSLRRLFLNGTPLAESLVYRSTIATTLPMLTSLDDQPLDTDVTNDDYLEEWDNSSESGNGSDQENDAKEQSKSEVTKDDAIAGPSSQTSQAPPSQDGWGNIGETTIKQPKINRRRPATTESAGVRPPKQVLPQRPRTAVDRPSVDTPTRLQIMNTLMDAEWRSSGSKLTSKGTVCGNLARALRRSSVSIQERTEIQEALGHTMREACRAVAQEIPRAPCHEAWVKFKEETGIEIDINFNEPIKNADASKALDRLDRIERETSERLKRARDSKEAIPSFSDTYKVFPFPDTHFWSETDQPSLVYNCSHSDIASVVSDNSMDA